MPSIDLGQVIGSAGPGVAAGGTTGQVLVKTGAGNYDTGWKTLTAGDMGALNQMQADARYMKLSGGDMSGMLDMKNHALTGIPDPVSPTDAVNYQFMIKIVLRLLGQISTTVVFHSAQSDYNDHEVSIDIENVEATGGIIVFKLDGVKNIPPNGIGYSGVTIKYPPGFGEPVHAWSEDGYAIPQITINSQTLYPGPGKDGYFVSSNIYAGDATFSGNLIVSVK